jgi:plastocyanin
VALALVVSIGALAPAFADERTDREPGTGTLGTTTTVAARDDFFRPRVVTISRGSSVRWVNRGDHLHTTTGGSWDVTLSPGESYTKRFRRVGTFRYLCTLHSGMTGRVVVQ